MSTTVGRRVGIVVVLALLAGAAGLVALPLGAAVVRVGDLSVLWWYGVVVAPGAAVLVVIAVLYRRAPGAAPDAPATPPA